MQNATPQILEISSSGRQDNSVSRQLSADLIAALESTYGRIEHRHRDVAAGIPLVDAAWIDANFTPDEDRSAKHRESLAYSGKLVAELQNADILVIGVAMYNFTITASLKAWIDMIARARLTFRYTDAGPKGLLTNKKAYLVVSTGGVSVGSAMDFATPYLKHVLAFVGIDDVEIIAADRLNSHAEESIEEARANIAKLVHFAPRAA